MEFAEQDFIIQKQPINKPDTLVINSTAPSNIALVKYWGKHGLQLPMNPSISFTLNKSQTQTSAHLSVLDKPSNTVSFTFYLDQKHKPDFEPKIAEFLKKIQVFAPFITLFDWKIYSHNTFPHSSGIASSASGFAALAKIIVNLEKQLYPPKTENYYAKKTSFLARLGSGSASRSTMHPVMIWGFHPKIKYTSDLYAVVPDFEIHPVFQTYKDSIILVEKGQKKVSSTIGHDLMNKHPFKNIRKQNAFEHVLQMAQYLKAGDLDNFIKLTEAEALELHALMMTSHPNYILMKPDTLKIIRNIRTLRNETGLPVCFTLDAGANVHILYPENIFQQLQQLFFSKIDQEIIHDFV